MSLVTSRSLQPGVLMRTTAQLGGSAADADPPGTSPRAVPEMHERTASNAEKNLLKGRRRSRCSAS